MNLFIVVNIEDIVLIFKKVVEFFKLELVRVGDVDKFK